MFCWNSKITTYYDKGKRAYCFGDEISSKVVHQMGKETFDEYVEKGLIAVAGKEATDVERDLLIEKAEKLGLKPHYKAGIPKIKAMIEDLEALQRLKEEALALGIDPSDDVTFEELTLLVNEKKDMTA